MRFAARVIAGLALTLAIAGGAHAATIEILASFPSGFNYGAAQISVRNFSARDLGAVKLLLADGADRFTPNSLNAAISPSDTMFLDAPVPGFDFDELVVSNLPGLSIAPAGATSVLGVLGLRDLLCGCAAPPLVPGETVIPGVGPAFPASLFDVDGNPIVPVSVEVIPSNGSAFSTLGLRFILPEPAPFALLLLGAVTVSLRRRKK